MKGWVQNLDKRSTHTETKGEKDEGARAQDITKTKTGGTGIYINGFPGIMREAQLDITVVTIDPSSVI